LTLDCVVPIFPHIFHGTFPLLLPIQVGKKLQYEFTRSLALQQKVSLYTKWFHWILSEFIGCNEREPTKSSDFTEFWVNSLVVTNGNQRRAVNSLVVTNGNQRRAVNSLV
jgi:hypothetical protein